MGSFFLTNTKDKEKIDKVIRLYKKKKMYNHTQLNFGIWELLYFSKINFGFSQIHSQNNDYAIGVGTFFYNDRYGPDALKEIYNDFLSGENVFGKIKGHFNFILFIDGKLYVITDKTGLFHSYVAYEKNDIYISNSFLAIGEILDNLTVSSQALMEFAITEAVYGGKTFFKEINHLESGIIFQVNKEFKKEKYFSPSYKENYSIEDIFNDCENYFEIFKKNDVDLKITADLSAGYDTRLVNAILKHKNIKYAFNVNTNTMGPSDTIIAREIAKRESKKLIEYQKQIEKYDYKSLIKETFFSLEASRDLFRAAYSHIFFDQKSKDFQLIIGGYGGELYREKKYIGINSLNALIESQYSCFPRIFGNYKKYKNNLSKELKKEFKLKKRITKKDIEKIYYFNRMRYWGGSRITYFNQYAYRIHPLFDFELASFLFDIPAKEKRNAKLQKILIDKFDHKLASYTSNYGYNFIYKPGPKNSIKNLYNILRNKLIITLKTIAPIIYILIQKKKLGRNYNPFYLKKEFIGTIIGTEDLMITKYLQLNPKYIDLEPLVSGRIYTIELILQYFKNKLNK